MRAYKANMIPGGTTPVINVSQYDNDYAVTVTLIEGAEIYTPPVGATIRVEGTKPDGHGFEYACTYQGNVVTMPIYTQMTVVAGRFPIELVVYQNGLRVGSCNIIFAVEKAPLGEDTDISETVIPDIIAGAQAQADAAAASAASAAEAAAQVLSSQIVTDASGSIASFSDGADDVAVKSLVAEITPVQNLNGQANPYPAGGGKNLLNNTSSSTTFNGITWTVNSDGTVTANGTATSNSEFHLPFNNIIVETNLYFSGCPSGGSTSKYCDFIWDITSSQRAKQWDNITTVVSDVGTTTDNKLYLESGHNYRMVLIVYSGQTVSNLVFKPMIRLATESDGTYAPYSNICPISGRTGMTVTTCGRNLFDGVFTQQNANQIQSAALTLPAGTYTYSQKYNGTPTWGVYIHRPDNTEVARVYNANKITFTLSQTDEIIIRVYYGSGITPSNVTEAQLEIGSTATTYEPYVGQTYPITWESIAGTVYGGTLDVVSGVLTVDKGFITLDGTQTIANRNWRPTAGSVGWLYPYAMTQNVVPASSAEVPAITSNRMKAASYSTLYNGTENNCIGLVYDTSKAYGLAVRYADTSLTTDAAINAFLAENPIQVVFLLETPQTYQLTPTEVRTLLGGNTIYSDAGDVSVEYIADTKLYIDNKIAELQALVLEN